MLRSGTAADILLPVFNHTWKGASYSRRSLLEQLSSPATESTEGPLYEIFLKNVYANIMISFLYTYVFCLPILSN